MAMAPALRSRPGSGIGLAALLFLTTGLFSVFLWPAVEPAAASEGSARTKTSPGKGSDEVRVKGAGKDGKEKGKRKSRGPRFGPNPPKIDAKAWILLDPRTGQVLAQKAADSERKIASTTKMMTAWVANGLLDPDRYVRAPRYRASPGESLAGLRPGDRLRVRDLLYALMLPSGNDAADALSRLATTGQRKFVREMNAAARRLGLSHSHFSTPVGLDEQGNYSSARDLAELGEVLLEDPLLRRIVDTKKKTIKVGRRKVALVNHNNLVLEKPWVVGIKTGYTSGAGYNLVGAGRRDNTTLLSVVLGAPSEAKRDSSSLDLLLWGFSRYRKSIPVNRGEQIVTSGIDFRDSRIPLLAGESLPVLSLEGQPVRVSAEAPDVIDGPTSKGARVGTVTVLVAGQPAASAPLVTGKAVTEATLGEKVESLALSPLILLPVGLLILVVGLVLWLRNLASSRDNGSQTQ